jgi:NitT/TauT family transport system permease protein
MKEGTKLLIWRLLAVLAGLSLLEAAVRAQWINPFFLASPAQAAEVLWSQLVSGKVLTFTLVTLGEIGAAQMAATLVGLLVGFLLWRYQVLGASYEMLLAALFASPIILVYPIFLVVFGRTSAAIIALSAILALIPIAINTKSAFAHINPVLVRVGASMNLSRRQIFRHILIPAAAPTVFSGFRLGLTYILKSVLGLEYIVQVGGIGMWVSDSAYRFEIGEVYAGVLGTVLLSLIFLYMINRTEGWVRR